MLDGLELFDYQRIDNVLGSVISNRLATLYELQTVYSLNDALTLYDILLTNNANRQKTENYLLNVKMRKNNV